MRKAPDGDLYMHEHVRERGHERTHACVHAHTHTHDFFLNMERKLQQERKTKGAEGEKGESNGIYVT